MITDMERRNTKDRLNQETLPDYWRGYFRYRDNANELYQLAQESLEREVENARGRDRPFIDSQQSIGRILNEFSSQHQFHRQFREQLPDLHSNLILGMHLYDIMINDEDTWIYTETQHRGHLFPHATYFIPKN
ncbi:MAG: hypothetical protein SD837_00200 [Candidatus Electrothrix scaldis]|nr:MAG: hypothetical protein SD837_00200 [Candidatus Electrothrix sp. GW3-3]